MTVATMGFLSRGLIDLLKKKTASEEQSRLLAELKALRRTFEAHAQDEERYHSESGRLLNVIVTNLARIEGRLGT